MPQIIIFGVPPDSDLKVLQPLVGQQSIELVVKPEPVITANADAFGYLSYLPCTMEFLLELFRSQPVGFGYKLPFFQRIEGDSPPEFTAGLPVYGFFASPLSPLAARNIINTVTNHAAVNTQAENLAIEVIQYRTEKNQLVAIDLSLSSVNDLGELLDIILTETRSLVRADAASIYVRDRKNPGGYLADTLRFKVTQNDSIDVKKTASEFTVPIDMNSISGYVACTGRPLVLTDVNNLPPGVPYKFGKDFEKRFGYRMKSMLTVPLKNIGGEVVGVLQLMNKKPSPSLNLSSPDTVEKCVQPFTVSDQELIRSVGSLAAISIERIQLYESIQQLFEGFLDSSITAIDERDRVTSGHSRRVMGYCLAFAEAMNRAQAAAGAEPPFTPERTRQLKFSALLHDIGKIGVPEHILTKENKLSAGELAALMARFDCVSLYQQYLVASARHNEIRFTAEELADDRAFVKKVNATGFLSDEQLARLAAIFDKYRYVLDGTEQQVFDANAREMLSIRRGNLSPTERDLINSHAKSTRRLLSKIPWNRDLERIPEIASHHHERIDGSGYPDGLHREQISLESRILAVVDIYEALVAQDRPYKPKMPPEKALEILRAEVKADHLDADVVNFFIEQGIYKTFQTAS